MENQVMEHFSKKHILVTGVAGFIGSHLALRLLSQETENVIVGVDNLSDYYDVGLKHDRLLRLAAYDHFHFVEADIADASAVGRIFDIYRPDIVVNLAAQAGVRYSIESPKTYMETNVMGFFNILEACRHSVDGGQKGVEHLVYASSSSVYGMKKEPLCSTKDKADTPVSLYAATKRCDELMAYSYSKLYDIPCTGLRFFTVYGPDGRPDMAYFSFADRMVCGDTIQLYNYGHCERDFTYIDDVVEGILRVLAQAPPRSVGDDGLPIAPHRVYNLGNGHPETLLSFVKTLQQELVAAHALPDDYELSDHCRLVPMQSGDVVETWADTAPFSHDFGFKPVTPLREGLRNFARWYASCRLTKRA